jgi:hypothetical protein
MFTADPDPTFKNFWIQNLTETRKSCIIRILTKCSGSDNIEIHNTIKNLYQDGKKVGKRDLWVYISMDLAMS